MTFQWGHLRVNALAEAVNAAEIVLKTKKLGYQDSNLD